MVVESLRSRANRNWGWVVTFASFLMSFFGYSILYCFSVTFVALKEEFDTHSGVTSWVGTIPIGLATSCGVIVTPLVQRFGNRPIAFIGIVCCFSSCLLTSIMTSFPPFFFTFSILYGIGIGFASLASMDLLIHYFPNKNCSRATLLSLVGSSLGLLSMSPLTYYLIKEWGWRNMLRLNGTILLLVGLPATMTFTRPSRVKQPKSSPIKNDGQDIFANSGTLAPWDNDDELADQRGFITSEKSHDELSTRANSKECGEEWKLEGRDEEEKNVGHCEQSSPEKTSQPEVDIPTGDDVRFFQKYKAIFYPDLWLLCIGITVLPMMNSFYYINVGDFLLSVGFEPYVIPWVTSALGISEVAGKIVLATIADRLPFPKIFLYHISSVVGIATMCGFLYARTVVTVICLACGTGMVVMTIVDALSYSICNQVFRPDDLVTTWTVVMVMQGFGYVLGSLFGESVDRTGSYTDAIYTSMGMYVFCILVFTLVPIYQRVFAPQRFVMVDHQNRCRKKLTRVVNSEDASVEKTYRFESEDEHVV